MNRAAHLDPLVLGEWADGQLPAGEKQRVEAHLAVCGECRAEADLAVAHFSVGAGHDLGETSIRLRRSFQEKLDDRIEDAAVTPTPVRRRGPSRPRLGRGSWWLAAAAIAFAGIGIQQMSLQNGPPAPSGDLRSIESGTTTGLEVLKVEDGWVVRPQRSAGAGTVRLVVETSDGRIVYQRSGDDLEWKLSRLDFPAGDEDILYFVRLSGTDETGRSWTTRSELLP